MVRKTLRVLVPTLAGVWIALLATAFGQATPVDFEAAAKKVKAGDALLIDVRELSEIKGGMVTGAHWLATSDIEDQSPRYDAVKKSLPKGKTIYLYCGAGIRSGRFAEALAKEGYQAVNLGSYAELKAAGLATKSMPDAKAAPCPELCPKGG